ncbi:hypothetical protein [Herbiconiux flava]|uniref:Large exoprotein n=1 Tax=Herbiconiux flava TaxID=881268 RepID=A0A852SNW6_9MICO|nr:hypothetical protein [Herbiconiux flava]NYD70495.1 hypothetical protein [Herbiconiux flava]GLK17250.1 hypothetical protein GCM10017602_17320 [Herbiconiux flava]
MTTDWLSGGFIIALAAVLWLAYLLPSWFRSRQYLATERNAVRLQQTLRILAETAEVPEEIRVEASARSIAEQERILKHRSQQQSLSAVPTAVRTADRLRRSRAVTALVLAVSLSVAVLGGMQAVYTGAWIILIGGALASVVSIAVLVRLARAGRRLRLPASLAPNGVPLASPELVDYGFEDAAAPAVVGAEDDGRSAGDRASGWVPVAVPRPLYLSRTALPLGLDQPAEVDVPERLDTVKTAELAEATARASRERAEPDHHESLRRAAASAEAALRARLEAESATVASLPVAEPVAPAAPVAPAVPSRFARMGIVDGDTDAHLDIDAVLARRRAG